MYNREAYINSDPPNKKDLLKLFGKNQNMVILDIGGCEGEDSLRYAKLFPNSSILIFEPLPSNQNLIIENLKKYKNKNITLFPIALSDKEELTDFYVSSGQPEIYSSYPGWDFGNKSSSLLAPQDVTTEVTWLKFDNTIKVKTNTLANILRERLIEVVDFVHIDVQGAELKVLKGAGAFLTKIKAIWLEVAEKEYYKNQPLRTDIELFMEESGFYLAKTELEKGSGDQLYINRQYFKQVSFLGIRKFIKY